jgi:hypothetical protein
MRHVLILIALTMTALSGCADLPSPGEAMETHGHADDIHADVPTAGDHSTDGPHMNQTAGDHAQTGMDRPTFPAAQGSVPTADEAGVMPQVSVLRFVGDLDLDSSGYVTGNGSLADPYVITGLYVLGDLMLQDTDACVTILENYIGGQLTLNWNAQCVHVHHNYIYDLRVNENIRRDGYATGGLLERNEIGVVGQLRHYDGEFRYNTVGPMPEGGLYDPVKETTPLLDQSILIANIDGFNQGLIQGNVFHGSVDLDFHGHHHGTGFFATHSHYHGDEEERKMPHDHTQRWTSVAFLDNQIIDTEGYGLRYEDRNHAGDDRTAQSEQEETLKEDHIHRSDILIADNTVLGAGIWVDVFNADDSNHHARNDGWLAVTGNSVELHERDAGILGMWGPNWQPLVGYQVVSAKELVFEMSGNSARFVALEQQGPLPQLGGKPVTTAFDLDRLTDGNVTFVGNNADGFDVGLSGSRFEDVLLRLADNKFGSATTPTDFDDSVEPQ